MTKKRWLILLLVVLGLCALTALCGTVGWLAYERWGESDGGKDDDDTVLVTPTRASQGGEGQEAFDADGQLRLAGGIPPTLDPGVVQDATSAEYIVHLFSGLVRLDQNLEIAPDLAESWAISEDGRTYRFELRSDATFQDGRRVTTEDVVYSIERALSPELESPVALSYLGDIEGAAAYAMGQAGSVTGLEAVDENTIEIRIDAPKAYFLAKLTYPTSYVVDREQVESDDEWMTSPNATGPFVLEELSASQIVLARNERYYGIMPKLARVTYVLDGGLPITMYESDELDLVEIGVGEIERVLDPYNALNDELVISPELSVQYLGLNVELPPFDDPLVRQAFAHAIDREKIAELVLKGSATAAVGVLPPGMPDFDPEFEGLAYDPQLARELLAASETVQAGAMPEIVLTVSGTSGSMPPVDGAVVAMIEENLGLEIMVEQVEWGYFLRDLNWNRYQLFSSGWIADYPDSQNFLDLLFHSESGQNHTGYANPEVDALLEQARVEQDGMERERLYREAEAIVVGEAPWIPLTHGVTYTLVKPSLGGYHASAGLYPWLVDIYQKE